MKKITKFSFLVFAVGILLSTGAFAQEKLGYVSPEPLLIKMPERIAADKAVEAFSKPLEADINSKVEALKQKEQALYTDIESQTLSPQKIQERKTALQTEYQAIVKAEEKATNDVQVKRQQLYAPILLQMQNAIDAVAKENGYTMVLDASVGAIVHAEDVTNLTLLVAKKLGITIEE